MADPKYVRLTERMAQGNVLDLNSGWSISGYDVKEFPDKKKTPMAAKYVRQKLSAGILEPASKAEFEEVQEAREASRKAYRKRLQDMAELGPLAALAGLSTHQERHIQQVAAASRTKVWEQRDKNTPDSDDDDGDEEPKAAKKKAAKKASSKSE